MVAANVAFGASALQAEGENVRENVDSIIHNIDPTETPFQMKAAKGKVESDVYEWLIDNYQPAGANAHVDGADFGATVTNDTTTAPSRVGNYSQILKKQIVIARRAESMTKHGRRSEMAFQVAKKGAELKRDIEFMLLANQIAVPESGATPARSAGVPAWLYTNTSDGPGAGAPPALSSTTFGFPTTARTAGTDQVLSEADLLDVIRRAWSAGGKPGIVMVNEDIKQRISSYLIGQSGTPRNATPYQDHGPKPSGGATVLGAVDFYVSDFGTLAIVPNRFQAVTFVFVLDMKTWAVKYLDGIFVEKLGKAGDYERRHLIADCVLQSKQEAANGLIGDVIDGAMTA
jgi:hypothetical protein